mmetsp:Transcript_24764/g.18735  ORF Transcript_24764/g.18735 Transcript_24764/m.18735 type:complete len:91 (+) Transcript_24764:464-736(+)
MPDFKKILQIREHRSEDNSYGRSPEKLKDDTLFFGNFQTQPRAEWENMDFKKDMEMENLCTELKCISQNIKQEPVLLTQGSEIFNSDLIT